MEAKNHELDDEVALVDTNNAAAATLLSPTLWVRPLHAQPIIKLPDIAATPLLLPNAVVAEQPTSQRLRPRKRPAYAITASPTAEGLLAMHDTDDGRQYDITTMKTLQEDIARANNVNDGLRKQLKDTTMELRDVHAQNDHIKRLLVALDVQRQDVELPECADDSAKRELMLKVGRRLVANLGNVPPTQQQRPQEQRPQRATHKRAPALGPEEEEEQGGNDDGDDGNNGDEHDGEAAEHVDDLDYEEHSVGRTRRVRKHHDGHEPPASPLLYTDPAEFPDHAQIAAGALTHAKGDAALAVWHLLDEALKGKREPVGRTMPRLHASMVEVAFDAS